VSSSAKALGARGETRVARFQPPVEPQPLDTPR
jgi:hypothetical protein